MECIFPLFFIEQKRGWSEIQANTPNYGIKGVKKSAIEFCLAIDSFEYEQKVAKLKKMIESAEVEWVNLRSLAENIADFNAVRVNKLRELDSNNPEYQIKFSYLEGDGFISVEEQEKALNKFLEKLLKEIVDKTPDGEKLNAQLAVMRGLRRNVEETSNSVEITRLSISDVEAKISTLKHDYEQYQQLNKLKKVGSDISADINTQKCPICESNLYDTLGNRTVRREPMTLEENIEFLKNQLDFFNAIKNRNIKQLEQLRAGARLLASKLEFENDKLNSLKEEIDDVNGVTKAILREQIQTEILLKNVLKLKEVQVDLNEQLSKIHSGWSNASNSLKQLRKNATTIDSGSVIRKLSSILKGNLSAFNFNHSDINAVSISPQTLRPEQEGYDIVAETSASDYIRVIWSYTLALLELAGKEPDIKHGGFIVFDEPRQHEASKLSFTNLIAKASESGLYGGQVIFATSLDA
uniref:hypothetical protein n=1 Tax=Crenothrix polyspora TaxID=360316 RepID=UPI000B352B57